jgi:hypothetical protein
MPSAAMLQAAAPALGGSSHHTAEVGRVLADALGGGHGGGPNIDALLDAVAGHSAGAPALAQVAADAGWAGLAVAQEAFSMEAFVMHQDAVLIA